MPASTGAPTATARLPRACRLSAISLFEAEPRSWLRGRESDTGVGTPPARAKAAVGWQVVFVAG